jgi:hypothetical protein
LLATAEMNTLPMRRSHPVPVYSAAEGEKRNAGKSPPPSPPSTFKRGCRCYGAAENAAAELLLLFLYIVCNFSLTFVINTKLRKSPQIFVKNPNGPSSILRGN